MSETPRPVRAWADYDEWSVFLNSMPMAGPWYQVFFRCVLGKQVNP